LQCSAKDEYTHCLEIQTHNCTLPDGGHLSRMRRVKTLLTLEKCRTNLCPKSATPVPQRLNACYSDFLLSQPRQLWQLIQASSKMSSMLLRQLPCSSLPRCLTSAAASTSSSSAAMVHAAGKSNLLPRHNHHHSSSSSWCCSGLACALQVLQNNGHANVVFT
jgi:hypothetical protein